VTPDLPAATRPTPKTSAAPIDEQRGTRVIDGPLSRGREGSCLAPPRRAVRRGHRDHVEVAAATSRPTRFERGQNDPVAMSASISPARCRSRRRVRRDERRDRALRGDDRRHDRDLADAQRGVRQLEPDDVEIPAQAEQSERRWLERRGAGADRRDREPDDDADDHHPARTTREPSIRLERDEQRVAAAQSTAAPRPPMMATTGQCGGS
jgi:hypothetical protein